MASSDSMLKAEDATLVPAVSSTKASSGVASCLSFQLSASRATVNAHAADTASTITKSGAECSISPLPSTSLSRSSTSSPSSTSTSDARLLASGCGLGVGVGLLAELGARLERLSVDRQSQLDRELDYVEFMRFQVSGVAC